MIFENQIQMTLQRFSLIKKAIQFNYQLFDYFKKLNPTKTFVSVSGRADGQGSASENSLQQGVGYREADE